MKKIVLFVLVALMIATTLSSCAVDPEDKGAIIPVSISKEMKSYDPVPMIYDAELVLNTGILFEGLTVLNENGKIEKGMAKNWYTKIDEQRGEYWLYFELEETAWDDEKYVQADDFVYAWRRILSSETSSPAACLLYGIKNAKAYKAGDVTADDLGVYAESDSLLKVEFEGPFDLDLFLETVSSPALVPQREDNVYGREDSWASSLDNFSANGAFTLKNLTLGEKVTFQRNAVYFRDKDSDSAVYKVVKPWKLTTVFNLTPAEQLEKYENSDIFFLSYFDNETYEEKERKVKTQDLLSVYSYYFNTKKAPFDNALVRRALSIALDREEIAEISGKGAEAANGFVTYGVHDAKTSKEFRKADKKLVDKNADMKQAKELIKQSGITPSDYTIDIYTLRDESDVAVAEYTKGVWEELGFKVKLSSGGGKNYSNKLYRGEFDVIGLDYQGLTPDAFSFLAPFAKEYSGQSINIESEVRVAPHVTGFDNEEYNALIDEAFNTLDNKKRVALLHEAEQLLMELCPVTPLHFNTFSYLKSSKLSGLEFTGYGYPVFTDVKLRGYEKSNQKIIAQEEAEKKAAIDAAKNKN